MPTYEVDENTTKSFKNLSRYEEVEERRRHVFFMLGAGKKISEIAEKLGVTQKTIIADKNYIESVAYDSLKTQIGKKSIYITLGALQQIDGVIMRLSEMVNQKKFKKSVIVTNPDTGKPTVEEVEVVPTISEIIQCNKAIIDAAKSKADLAINNYVFIAESEALKKLETDVLKIDMHDDDFSDYPAGFESAEDYEKHLKEETNSADNPQIDFEGEEQNQQPLEDVEEK